MDQTSFTTVDFADTIKEQLTLDPRRQVTEGNTFRLKLEVPISYEDTVEDGEFTLIVERVKADPAFVHANGEPVYTTWARVEPSGDAFRVTIAVPEDGQFQLRAVVYVSSDMERVVHEFLARQDRIS